MIESDSRIVIAGAGSIGCYVGGRLAAAGKAVTLFVRPRFMEGLRQEGLKIIDTDGSEKLIEPEQFSLTSDPEIAFRQADIILVTVKSGATEEMAKSIRESAPSDVIVVSLQNGVGNAETLRQHLPAEATVISGMVPARFMSGGQCRGPYLLMTRSMVWRRLFRFQDCPFMPIRICKGSFGANF